MSPPRRYLRRSSAYTAVISSSDTTSAHAPPAVTAAQLCSRSPAAAKDKNHITHVILTSCSIRCTSVGFHTRPEAVKYPSMTDESAMHGRLMLVMRSERTVRASPIQRKPTGSARKYTIVPAHRPKNSA